MITPRVLLVASPVVIRDRLSTEANPQTCFFARSSPVAFFLMIRNDAYKPISDITAVVIPKLLGIGDISEIKAMPLSSASILIANPKRDQNIILFIA